MNDHSVILSIYNVIGETVYEEEIIGVTGIFSKPFDLSKFDLSNFDLTINQPFRNFHRLRGFSVSAQDLSKEASLSLALDSSG